MSGSYENLFFEKAGFVLGEVWDGAKARPFMTVAVGAASFGVLAPVFAHHVGRAMENDEDDIVTKAGLWLANAALKITRD